MDPSSLRHNHKSSTALSRSLGSFDGYYMGGGPDSTTSLSANFWEDGLSVASTTPSMKNVRIIDWTIEEVAEWIASKDILARYAASFIEHQVDGRQLLILSDEDMNILGITTTSHRNVLYASISALKKRHNKKLRMSPMNTPDSSAMSFDFQRKSPSPSPSNSTRSLPQPLYTDLKGGSTPNLPSRSNTIAVKRTQSRRIPNSRGNKKYQYANSLVQRSNTLARRNTRQNRTKDDLATQLKTSSLRLINSKTTYATDDEDDDMEVDYGDIPLSFIDDEKSPITPIPSEFRKNKSKVVQKTQTLPVMAGGKPIVTKKRSYSGGFAQSLGIKLFRANKGEKRLSNVQSDRKEKESSPKKKPHKTKAKKAYPLCKKRHQLMYEGWLNKRGPKKSSKFRQRWAQLFDNGHLYYFEHRPVTEKDVPIGYLEMMDALDLAFEEGQRFNVKMPKRIWYFECLSSKNLVDWIANLQQYMPRYSRVSISEDITRSMRRG